MTFDRSKSTADKANTVSAINQLNVNDYISFINKDGKGKRIMFAGNSITRHGVKEDIGWFNDFGMAASSIDKDYVHIIAKRVSEIDSDATFCIAQCASWERGFWDDAVYEKFEIAKFSSRGPAGYFYKPDLIAPAVNIIGASIEDNFYTKMSGTSVATPMIAGICCLILSKYPLLTPDQLKIRLLRNCKQITNNKNFEGFGLPNFENFFIY